MTFISGFFNSVNGDRRYLADFFAEYFASFIGNGVFINPGNALQVTEGNGMTTVIKAGKCWINGYYGRNKSDYIIQHDLADGVLKRIDRIVLRLDFTNRDILPQLKKGAYASVPVAPALQRDADAYELGIADVLIDRGATQITQANITDLRLDPAMCGKVHGVVDQVDTSTIFDAYQSWITQQKDIYEADITQWTADQQSDFLNWREDEEGLFNEWLDGLRDILDENVAGNLLQMIEQNIADIQQVQNNLDDHKDKIASETEAGHVKVDGETITIDEVGVISANPITSDTETPYIFAERIDAHYSVKVIKTDVGNRLSQPSSQPLGAEGIAFTSENDLMAVAHRGGSPYLEIYKIQDREFTKVFEDNEVTRCVDVSFSPDGNYLAVASEGAPFLVIYKRNGDTFTKLPNPVTIPTGVSNGVSFSPDGIYLAVAHREAPFLTIYKRNGDLFTKLPNPTSLPTGIGASVSFSNSGEYLAVSHSANPYISIYKRNGDTFTKLPNPTALPTNNGVKVVFSPDGIYLAVSYSSSPYIIIYRRNGSTFTKVVDVTPIPTSIIRGIAFGKNSNNLTLGLNSSPFLPTYEREGDIFSGGKSVDSPPDFRVLAVEYSPDRSFLAVGVDRAPRLILYDARDEVIKGDKETTRDTLGFGVATESGTKGDLRNIKLLWRL